MPHPGRTRPPEPIGDIAVTPRSLWDYRDMFLLDDGELLGGPILDCPGGASPFGAQVRARGGIVVSVDPEYHRPVEVLVARVRADLQRTAAWMAAHPTNFDWSSGLGAGGEPRLRAGRGAVRGRLRPRRPPLRRRQPAAAAVRRPLVPAHPQQPPAVQLPAQLDFDTHLASLLELVRVTAGEARVYPVVDTVGRRYPRLDELRATLGELGVASELRAARCVWQPGGDQLLACWRRR